MILSNTMKSEVRAFIKKRLQKTEIIRTIVIKTPYALNNNETKQFQQLFGPGCTINNDIDSSILGGFIMRDGSNILDGSIKGELEGVVNSLLNS